MINSFLFLSAVSFTSVLVLSIVNNKKHLETPLHVLRRELIYLYEDYFEFSYIDAVIEVDKLNQKEIYDTIREIRNLQKKEEKTFRKTHIKNKSFRSA